MTEMDTRIVQLVDEGAAQRIRELEAELTDTKTMLASSDMERESHMDRLEILENVIESLCHQFAYEGPGTSITTGGLSVLEEAFQALGWEDPHPVPERCCDEPGCSAIADCGWPSDAGYRRTCGHHMPKEWK